MRRKHTFHYVGITMIGKATLFKVVEGKLFGLLEPASIRRVRAEGQDNSAENPELGHRQSFTSRSLNCIQPEAKLSKTCKRQQLLSGARVRDSGAQFAMTFGFSLPFGGGA